MYRYISKPHTLTHIDIWLLSTVTATFESNRWHVVHLGLVWHTHTHKEKKERKKNTTRYVIANLTLILPHIMDLIIINVVNNP